ncbi:hypothetical protein [Nocardia xishanensis]|uniref:Cupin domain-containing protein n=1 Tax=Nocardia xishanensis TaxID=238964 RepID=A0ABW7XBU2_9NOCA
MRDAALNFANGHQVAFVDRGVDDRGPYLRLEHLVRKAERQAGPYWHPTLAESWTVREGRLRFRVDGVETIANPGTR